MEGAVPPDPKRKRVTKSVQIAEADMVKAEFLALVLMRHSDTQQGVLIKNSVSGQWNEDPAIVEHTPREPENTRLNAPRV